MDRKIIGETVDELALFKERLYRQRERLDNDIENEPVSKRKRIQRAVSCIDAAIITMEHASACLRSIHRESRISAEVEE